MARGRWTAAFLHGGGRLPGSRLVPRLHAWLYRRSRGRRLARWFGAPVLVLEVVGRRSGRLRTVSIVYLPTSEGWLVTAANAGNDEVPRWWLNLRDAGEAVVTVGGRREPVTPRLLEGEERERRWRELVAAYPSIGHYARYTDRVFPLVLLEPRS